MGEPTKPREKTRPIRKVPRPRFDKEPLEKVAVPLGKEFRVLSACKLYATGQISSERAAEMAGMNHVAFILNLGFYKIFPLEGELTELENKRG